jgi:hypothetical protein
MDPELPRPPQDSWDAYTPEQWLAWGRQVITRAAISHLSPTTAMESGWIGHDERWCFPRSHVAGLGSPLGLRSN